MYLLIRFPYDALPDIRALLQLSVDQLASLAQLLDTKEAAPPVDQEFEDHVRDVLRVTPEAAEAVVRISLIVQGTNLEGEKAVKVVEDFIKLIGLLKPDDQADLLHAIIQKHEALIKVVTRRPAIARELQRRAIASGTQPAIESIRTLVQLRPMFERNEDGEPVDTECLIPAMTLELKYERDNREQCETFSLTEETLDELIGSLEDAKTQWALLKQEYSDPEIGCSKFRVTVAGYQWQLAARQNDYNVAIQSWVLSEVGVKVRGEPSGWYPALRDVGLKELERYELASKIITGVRRKRKVLRMADGKSIADRSIDYERLFTRMARIQTSGGMYDFQNVAGCMDESEMHVNVAKPIIKRVGQGKKTPPRSVILSVTGSLAEKTSKHFVINWDGGGKLTVARSRAEGDWDQLSVGQWIEATISRRITGEVVSALLVGTIEEPQGLSEEELSDSYSSLPAADLDPME